MLEKFRNFVDVTAIWLFLMKTTIAHFRRFIRTPHLSNPFVLPFISQSFIFCFKLQVCFWKKFKVC